MTRRKLKKSKKILISGNEAIGKAAIQAGCGFYAGYPITPQNELIAYMAKNMPLKGMPFVQAESEIAAVNMIFGAAVTGVRTMTTSSSPGVSLKQEGISYLAACQLPSVIVNVMRGGPGLGNIAPAQSDYFQATKGGGHGDYRLIVLAPSSVSEAFKLTGLAFDLADKYRTPVMILMDAFIGQMSEAIEMPDTQYKIGNTKNNWALTGAKNRNSRSNQSLFLKDGVLEKHNLVLQKKFKKIAKQEKRFEEINTKDADVVFVVYGISFRIAKEAIRTLSKKIKVGIFRPITLWPFPSEALEKACKNKKDVFVFELSYGQMVEDVKLAVGKEKRVHFYGRSGGEVFTEKELIKFVNKTLNSKNGK